MTVFFRCNSGHYFSGAVCYWDGWTLPGFGGVLKIVEQLRSANKPITIAALRESGVTSEILNRIMIVEFGDAEVAVETIYPKQVVAKGKVVDRIR